ncbi:class I SAM-dependent methyltransferase [Shouchella hunanensis]|uniref:Class I SAM-dependent methyltransferase n=1 Tax=Shouchella hunanensis TaxID=766894 RepID=A0ABY7W491_9BACI|nr:class I SAM-dependent methyltransferase [Shouchella hunanensis]WDF03694.1 class I SAM-dependent methyltransferase [Shouchella hunanensis]
MIVTTARKQVERLKEEAMSYITPLNGTFIDRNDRSIEDFYLAFGDQPLLVVAKDKLILHKQQGAEPFYYHPNVAFLRYKQWRRSGYDPFLAATELHPGDTFIDATLGMGADATMAQLAVGQKGQVIGLEANAYIAFIVSHGLANWREGDDLFIDALRRINVTKTDSLSFLKKSESKSVDVVYFDPMFDVRLHSPGIAGLKQFASYQSLTATMVEEAKRVARKKVVLKNHTKSDLFATLGFSVEKRANASFQYGVIKQ